MADCGDRVFLLRDAVSDDGTPVERGRAGVVIAHRGDSVIVSLDLLRRFVEVDEADVRQAPVPTGRRR